MTREPMLALPFLFKLVNGNVPNYLYSLLPPLVSDRNPYHHRNPLERDIPFCRTTLYQKSFLPATTEAWNALPDDVKRYTSLSLFKRYLASNDAVVPKYFYIGSRNAQIVHSKLRLGISDLNQHMYYRHLTQDQSCACGSRIESSLHYLLHCPLYDAIRPRTIYTLDANYTVNDFLNGNASLTADENKVIFLTVQNFIILSGRFNL